MKNRQNKMTEAKRMQIDAQVQSFMDNVHKLDTISHLRTHGRGPIDCTVTISKPGWINNGKRVYAVSNSKLIRNGSYSYATLREKLTDALTKRAIKG